MTRGVIIYAFKKPAYGKFAFNLAASIRYHSPDLPICLIHDEEALKHLQNWQRDYFHKKIKIDRVDLYDGPRASPGKAKLSGYKYFPFDQNMIIDADSICIKDIRPLFDQCNEKPVYSQAVGSWNQDADSWTCQWMPLKLVKGVFDLPKEYRIFEINSSFMLIRKSPEAQKFYAQAFENYMAGNNHPKVRSWGGTFPDELAFNVAFAQCGIEPHFHDQEPETLSNAGQKPVFFSTRFTNDWGFVAKNYHFIGFFGDMHFTSRSLQEHYDRLMKSYGAAFEFSHYYKIHQLMKEKHVLSK